MLSASSPDDEALVLAAKYFGFEFVDRIHGSAVVNTWSVTRVPRGVAAIATAVPGASSSAAAPAVAGSSSPLGNRLGMPLFGKPTAIKTPLRRRTGSVGGQERPDVSNMPRRGRASSVFSMRFSRRTSHTAPDAVPVPGGGSETQILETSNVAYEKARGNAGPGSEGMADASAGGHAGGSGGKEGGGAEKDLATNDSGVTPVRFEVRGLRRHVFLVELNERICSTSAILFVFVASHFLFFR